MTFTDPKTWLVTGAARGMGVDFARAALAAGHNVVATGRTPETVSAAVGEHENLLVSELEINDTRSAEQAIAEPPLRWVAGEDAVERSDTKARLLLAQVDAHRALSTNLAHDDARVAA